MRHRILFIDQSTLIGGSVLSLYELVRGLDPESYEPVVLFYHPHPARRQFEESGIRILTLEDEAPLLKPVDRPRNGQDAGSGTGFRVKSLLCHEVPAALGLRRLLQRERVHLVHHNTHLFWDRTNVVAVALSGLPQICHIRNFRALSPAERWTARCADFCIYTSTAIERHCRQAGIPAGKGRTIHNPIDVERFARGDGRRVRSELQLSEDDLVISNVGRIDTWKGHDDFLRAMAEVVSHRPQVKALIVGAFPEQAKGCGYDREIQALIRQLGLENHVVLTGFRGDVADVMAASDVLVHSASEPEPFGRVVAEGMAAGRPVVATAAGGVIDILEDGESGLLVPCKDPSALASAIVYLLDHPQQARRLAAMGRRRAAERFSIERHVSSVQQIYHRLLALGEAC